MCDSSACLKARWEQNPLSIYSVSFTLTKRRDQSRADVSLAKYS